MAGMFKEGKIRTRGMGEEFRSSRNTHLHCSGQSLCSGPTRSVRHLHSDVVWDDHGHRWITSLNAEAKSNSNSRFATFATLSSGKQSPHNYNITCDLTVHVPKWSDQVLSHQTHGIRYSCPEYLLCANGILLGKLIKQTEGMVWLIHKTGTGFFRKGCPMLLGLPTTRYNCYIMADREKRIYPRENTPSRTNQGRDGVWCWKAPRNL